MIAERGEAVVVSQKATEPRCVLCFTRLECVFDLGHQPLANALLLAPDDPCPVYPLRLGHCAGCGHVQVMDPVPPEAMFSHYVYRTGASAPARKHFAGLADALRERLPREANVLEVGSGDGTLLREMEAVDLNGFGMDPSDAAEMTPFTTRAYFNDQSAQDWEDGHGKPQAIVMCNVLAHCPRPAEIVQAAAKLLAPGGLLVIEVPYFRDLFRARAYDGAYHEHAHQLQASTLHQILTPLNLYVEQVQRLPVHGGSLRLWCRRVRDTQRHAQWCAPWMALRSWEWEHPLDWDAFRRDVQRDTERLQESCAKTELLVGYGAPAKGTVLLGYTGIRPDYVVDSTPEKQGKWIPGVRVPIVHPSEIGCPDGVLALAWNYLPYLKEQHPELAGKWIVPFEGLG